MVFLLILVPFFVLPMRAQSAAHSDPVEYTSEDRVKDYLHRTYSWQRMTLLAGETGVIHVFHPKGEWGNGLSGFGADFSSGFARRVVRNTLELGLSAAFQEDRRYRPSGEKGVWKRVRYASLHSFTAKTPDGLCRPAYSRFGATIANAYISSVWQPRPMGHGDVWADIGSSFGDYISGSMLDEFSPDLKKFGKRRAQVFRRLIVR